MKNNKMSKEKQYVGENRAKYVRQNYYQLIDDWPAGCNAYKLYKTG